MAISRRKVRWTAARLSLLGQIPDAELARRMGCKKLEVAVLRRMHGIKAMKLRQSHRCSWGQTELDLLRNYSDREIAKMTGRTVSEISAKRSAICRQRTNYR
jgi:hypothetical protein